MLFPTSWSWETLCLWCVSASVPPVISLSPTRNSGCLTVYLRMKKIKKVWILVSLNAKSVFFSLFLEKLEVSFACYELGGNWNAGIIETSGNMMMQSVLFGDSEQAWRDSTSNLESTWTESRGQPQEISQIWKNNWQRNIDSHSCVPSVCSLWLPREGILCPFFGRGDGVDSAWVCWEIFPGWSRALALGRLSGVHPHSKQMGESWEGDGMEGGEPRAGGGRVGATAGPLLSCCPGVPWVGRITREPLLNWLELLIPGEIRKRCKACNDIWDFNWHQSLDTLEKKPPKYNNSSIFNSIFCLVGWSLFVFFFLISLQYGTLKSETKIWIKNLFFW